MTRSPDDLPPRAAIAVAHGEARLPRRAARPRARVRDDGVHGAARRVDRAVAQAPRRRLHSDRDRTRIMIAAFGLAASATRDVVPARRVHARAAPLPRQDLGRARGARRDAAGVGRDHRAPRAARVPRPAGGAARPGVRARPPLHVAVLDAWAGSCASSSRSLLLVSVEPGPRVPPAVRDPDRDHQHVAARRRAPGRGVGRAARPARAPPVPARHDRARGQGAARRGHRRAARARPPRARGTSGTARSRTRADDHRALAHARVGDLRRRVRRRDRLRRRRARRERRRRRSSSSPRAAASRSTSAPRSASSASCAASGSTRRGGSRGSRTTPRARPDVADAPVPERIAQRHPARARVVRVPGHRPRRAHRRRPRAARRMRWSRSSARTARARARS